MLEQLLGAGDLPPGDTQEQKFRVAPALAGVRTPQGTGSLPRARVVDETRDKHRDSHGERSPKDAHRSPSGELAFQLSIDKPVN
ncbi:hypothetical protein DUI87_14131 [Hirundo rustica rustica]|uniref:Uncharacterized protein n=1 Tax=Hirundo rustica rustica TaxID=333673 RepID=A0A3M0K7P5_HIRRU|nr:hypothetical protein DUI87_14131 [Hirundo rustica rustica]